MSTARLKGVGSSKYVYKELRYRQVWASEDEIFHSCTYIDAILNASDIDADCCQSHLPAGVIGNGQGVQRICSGKISNMLSSLLDGTDTTPCCGVKSISYLNVYLK